jgi:hypothetical protein
MNVLITEGQYDRLFVEQPDSRFSFGYNPWSKDPNNLRNAMKRQEEFNSEVFKFIDENKHGLLDIAAIGTAFIPLVGPFISLGLELGNAALYANEGDNYSAGLALSFALIPGGQLIRRIPSVKKLGRNGLALLLKKAKNPKLVKTLTKTEKESLEQINKNSKWITLTAAKELSKKIAKVSVKKMKLPQLVKFVYSFSKKYPKTYNITTMGLQIGGIWYSYDKLAQIYGLKDKSESNIEGNQLISKKQLESQFNNDKEKLNSEIVNSLTNGLTNEQLNKDFQKRLGEDIKFD